MLDEARRFRQRSCDCRQLAASARDARDRRILIDLAEELDAEADRIDDEESGGEAKP